MLPVGVGEDGGGVVLCICVDLLKVTGSKDVKYRKGTR